MIYHSIRIFFLNLFLYLMKCNAILRMRKWRPLEISKCNHALSIGKKSSLALKELAIHYQHRSPQISGTPIWDLLFLVSLLE